MIPERDFLYVLAVGLLVGVALGLCAALVVVSLFVSRAEGTHR